MVHSIYPKMSHPRRPLVSVLLSGAIVSLALIGADRYRSEKESPVEEPASALPVVQWTFGPAELITCKTPAYVLRHLRDDLGPGVRIIAYGVGVSEQEARSFLHAERVPAELRTATAEHYRSEYNASPVSGVYIVSRGKIVRSFPAVPNYRYPDVEMLRIAVEPYLASAAVRGRSHPPTLRHPG